MDDFDDQIKQTTKNPWYACPHIQLPGVKNQ